MAPADKGTGKKQDIKITGASTLGSDEVDRMVKDAEQYADEDKKQREAVDVKNQARFSLSVVGHALMRKVVSLWSVCGADWRTHVLLLFLLSIPWPNHRCLRLSCPPLLHLIHFLALCTCLRKSCTFASDIGCIIPCHLPVLCYQCTLTLTQCVQADSLVYQTEKQLKELGDKVPAEVKSKVEAKVSELKEVAAKDDVEGTKKVIDELQKEVSIPSLQRSSAISRNH